MSIRSTIASIAFISINSASYALTPNGFAYCSEPLEYCPAPDSYSHEMAIYDLPSYPPFIPDVDHQIMTGDPDFVVIHDLPSYPVPTPDIDHKHKLDGPVVIEDLALLCIGIAID